MTERLKQFAAQFTGKSPIDQMYVYYPTLPQTGAWEFACNNDASTSKNPDDVVITLAIRTPLTKGGKGGFKDTPLDAIVVKLLKEVVKRINIDPALVEDICLGNVHMLGCMRKI
jgi:hypothetical protein